MLQQTRIALIDNRSGRLSPPAAPRPPHRPRARRRLPKAPTILDFGFSIFDCRNKNRKLVRKKLLSFVFFPNPKSKIANPKSSNHPIRSRQHVRRNRDYFGFSIADFRLFGHRITRSALARTLGGIVNPICLAVLRLIASSNFVGCSTGRSLGFAPLRILSTYMAARRSRSAKFGP